MYLDSSNNNHPGNMQTNTCTANDLLLYLGADFSVRVPKPEMPKMHGIHRGNNSEEGFAGDELRSIQNYTQSSLNLK